MFECSAFLLVDEFVPVENFGHTDTCPQKLKDEVAKGKTWQAVWHSLVSSLLLPFAQTIDEYEG